MYKVGKLKFTHYALNLSIFMMLCPSIGFGFINLGLVGSILFIILSLLKNKFRIKNDLSLKVILFMLILMTISACYSMLIFNDSEVYSTSKYTKVITQYVYWIINICVVYFVSKNSISIKYEKIIFSYAAISLIIFILNMKGIALSNILPISDIGLRDMRPVYIGDKMRLGNIVRNVSLLGEASFLGGIMAVSFFMVKRRMTKVLIILNLILTFSRLSYIAFIVGFILKIYVNSNISLRKKVTITCLLIIAGSSFFGKVILQRLTYFSNGDISTIQRSNQILVSMRMFVDNFIFGVGLGRFGFEYSSYNLIIGNAGFVFPISGSVYTLIMTEFGIIGILITVLLIGKSISDLKNSNKIYAFVTLLVFLLNYGHINLFIIAGTLGIVISNSKGENVK